MQFIEGLQFFPKGTRIIQLGYYGYSSRGTNQPQKLPGLLVVNIKTKYFDHQSTVCVTFSTPYASISVIFVMHLQMFVGVDPYRRPCEGTKDLKFHD